MAFIGILLFNILVALVKWINRIVAVILIIVGILKHNAILIVIGAVFALNTLIGFCKRMIYNKKKQEQEKHKK